MRPALSFLLSRKSSCHSGFTLAETLMAALIGMLAIGGIIQVFNASRVLVRMESEKTIAQGHIKNIIETISMTPFNLIVARFPSWVASGGGVTDYAAIAGGLTLPNEQIRVYYTDVNANPLEIVVMGNWLGPRNQTIFVTLSTLRTK